eukprot:TRINITY_DN13919_c0_g1_i1.p2 TRINITY_DN13919_c0_g1~~TRINITY_DN13919_c0_g1_i1.p2  ORF type:complete len:248 (+),score=23.15 TRINITY_DN13919_c0_g1_i1:827-1570(+)
MGSLFSSESNSCPIGEYNVYNERVQCQKGLQQMNPDNNMPLEPAQQPFPGQKQPLSVQREQSSIPKGGAESTWLYPSPQMFYNALKRKGKGDDVTEEDMDSVVFTHNQLNEDSWRKVMDWEQRLHQDEYSEARLLRFTGVPDQLSPLARFRNLVTGEMPFDRHDWYVVRNGKEVRYIIDYYFNEEKQGQPDAFEIVARPALDSSEAMLDRVKMSIYLFCAHYNLPCPVSGHSPKELGDSAQVQEVSN